MHCIELQPKLTLHVRYRFVDDTTNEDDNHALDEILKTKSISNERREKRLLPPPSYTMRKGDIWAIDKPIAGLDVCTLLTQIRRLRLSQFLTLLFIMTGSL